MNLRPLKYFCTGQAVYGLNISASRYQASGVRFLRTTDVGDDGQLAPNVSGVFLDAREVPHNYFLRDGDLLLSRSGTLGRCLLFRGSVSTTHAGYLVRFRPKESNHPPYLAYCAQSNLMQNAVAADAIESTIGNFNAEKYAAVRLPWWPKPTQRAIADYLDREVARVDILITSKRLMVKLLEERRHSARERLVSEAQSAGSIVRLGHLLREVDERLCDADPPQLLSVSIHHGVIPFAEANPDRVPRADGLRNYKRCEPDDIILNRMRAFQGGIGRATTEGIVSPDYAVLRPTTAVSPRYLNHLLRSPWFVGQMKRILRGIGGAEQANVRTPRVNWDDMRTVVVPSPSLATQMHLAEKLASELSTSRQVQETIERQLARIQEHRQALITAAVTGQLDVPGA